MTQHVDSFHGIPHDARMLGLDRHTQEGALISMAGSLNPTKLSHKVVAWLMLLAFIAPGLLGSSATSSSASTTAARRSWRSRRPDPTRRSG